MKKLLGISICLLLICLATVPTVVFAADSAGSDGTTEDIVHFINPTAITTIDGYLFVADTIEDDKSAIIYFDVRQDTPVLVSTLILDGEVVTNVSDNGSDKLYAITDKQVLELAWDKSEQQLTKSGVTYRVKGNPTIIDFAYGVSGANGKTEYYLTANYLWRNVNGEVITAEELSNGAVACYAMDNYVYYAYVSGGVTYCKRYDGVYTTTEKSQDKFNTSLDLGTMNPLGFFTWEDKISIFSSKKLVSVTVSETGCATSDLISNYGTTEEITDVSATENKIFVLNNRNVVDIYTKGADGTVSKSQTIGSDILKQAVPTDFTSFTLVKSLGYPTNIVFKTEGDNSVEALEIIDNTTYIVLGYDGDSTSNYYYVLLGNKFGWVKKGDNTKPVTQDDKLQVIDTRVSDGNVIGKAKFASQNAIYVAPLPHSYYYTQDYYKVYTQSAQNRIDVTVLQQFSQDDTIWYYVSFTYDGEIQSGFVPAKAIGEFSRTGNTDGVVIAYYRKINTALFSTIKVYDNPNPATMTDEHLAYDGEGNPLKPLASGRIVAVISEADGVAYVHVEGTNAFGYVFTDNLIGEHQLTTNAIVGLTLLAVAIALGVTLAVVFLKRRKRAKNGETTPADKN